MQRKYDFCGEEKNGTPSSNLGFDDANSLRHISTHNRCVHEHHLNN